MHAVLTVTLEAHDEATITLLIEALWRSSSVVAVADTIHQLSPQAMQLLQALANYGPITSALGGERAGIQRHSARALLSTCVAVGAVERIEQGAARGTYRRATTFALTERGRRLIGVAGEVSTLGLVKGGNSDERN